VHGTVNGRQSDDRRATFWSYLGWPWLMWPQPGEELERVMGIEPTLVVRDTH